MIPEFDENGNLPPGIHEATFEEIVARFSLRKSRMRRSRTEKLRAFYRFIEPFAEKLYIDGSYTTDKLSPNDVDIVLFLKSDFNFNSRLGLRLRRFVDDKRIFHLHAFVGRTGDPNHEQRLQNYVDYFQKNDRCDPPVQKGVILVRFNND